MAAVLNRTTKAYLPSANTPDFPVAEWIINPDLSAVVGFPSKYWEISGDVVSLMSQVDRDALDAADMQSQRDAAVAQLQQVEDVLRAFMLTVLDEFNRHALKHNELLDAIDGAANSAAGIKTAVAAITDYPQRTELDLRTVIRAKLGS